MMGNPLEFIIEHNDGAWFMRFFDKSMPKNAPERSPGYYKPKKEDII